MTRLPRVLFLIVIWIFSTPGECSIITPPTIKLSNVSILSPMKPTQPRKKPKKRRYESVTATAYFSGNKTASGLKLGRKHSKRLIALSRDLARGYKFGQIFSLDTREETFEVVFHDIMPSHWKRRVDLYITSSSECKRWGSKKVKLTPLD
jgi:3D (Asp-Asp-Asp) domain-containing protein